MLAEQKGGASCPPGWRWLVLVIALAIVAQKQGSEESTLSELAAWAAILTFLMLIANGVWRVWRWRRPRYVLRLATRRWEDLPPNTPYRPTKHLCVTGDDAAFVALAYSRDDYEIRACRMRLLTRHRLFWWEAVPYRIFNGFDFGSSGSLARPTYSEGWWWANVSWQTEPGKPLTLTVHVAIPEEGWRGYIEFGGIDKRDKWSYARAVLHLDYRESASTKRARAMFDRMANR